MNAIAAHTSSLARYLHARLSSLRHGSGDRVVRFFGCWESTATSSSPSSLSLPSSSRLVLSKSEEVVADKLKIGLGKKREGDASVVATSPPIEGQGPVLAMGFLRPGEGGHVGHAEVEKLASLEGIQLRTGCFCNPGACQKALGLNDDDVKEHLER